MSRPESRTEPRPQDASEAKATTQPPQPAANRPFGFDPADGLGPEMDFPREHTEDTSPTCIPGMLMLDEILALDTDDQPLLPPAGAGPMDAPWRASTETAEPPAAVHEPRVRPQRSPRLMASPAPRAMTRTTGVTAGDVLYTAMLMGTLLTLGWAITPV